MFKLFKKTVDVSPKARLKSFCYLNRGDADASKISRKGRYIPITELENFFHLHETQRDTKSPLCFFEDQDSGVSAFRFEIVGDRSTIRLTNEITENDTVESIADATGMIIHRYTNVVEEIDMFAALNTKKKHDTFKYVITASKDYSRVTVVFPYVYLDRNDRVKLLSKIVSDGLVGNLLKKIHVRIDFEGTFRPLVPILDGIETFVWLTGIAVKSAADSTGSDSTGGTTTTSDGSESQIQ